jgi:hypothetical protein
MAVTDDGILMLPLSQGSSRRAEITFSVRRPMPRAGQRLRLPLPVPIADSIGTGELVIASTSDANLLPDLENSIGLVAMPFAQLADAPASEMDATQRFRVTLPEAVFAADRVTRTRQVSSESAAEISFEPFDVRVEQKIDYTVRYEPIKELLFEVPRELALDEENLGIYLAPQAGREEYGANSPELPLSLDASMGTVEASEPGGTRRMRAVLPNPRLGEFTLQIRYRVPLPRGGAAGGSWRLPLVRPSDGRIQSQSALVKAPSGVTLKLGAKSDDSSWTTATPAVAQSSGSTSEFVADGSAAFLPLIINMADIDTPSAIMIERAWLQSWFSGEMRQDRAAFRLRTTGSQVTVELPPRVSPAEVEVLLDGEAAMVASRDTGRIVARLPQAASQTALRTVEPAMHTLELRYRQTSRDSLVSRHNLTPPQVVGSTALSGLYWQIVLPGDRHIVRAPRQMTSASEWQWLGSFWGRRPLRSQSELEEWVGASRQLPATGLQNEYLFTSLAPLSSIELVVVPRWLVVLFASACVLLLALAWIYVPVIRRVQILIAVAILLAGLAITFPVPALLLAQASILGIVLAGLALLVARLVQRPARWPVVLPAGSSLRHATPRAESIVMPPVAATASTSPTISLRMSESE